MAVDPQRPLIHLNFAVDARGRVAAEDGTATDISCARDWQRVHTLRERYSAVGVGAHTWLRDRPRLTVRAARLGRAPQRQPSRVIFAGSHRCPVDVDERPTFVVGTQARQGDEVIIAYRDRQLQQPLSQLYGECGVESLLVEGGPTLLRSFVAQGTHDRITIFVQTTDVASADRAARAVVPGLPDKLAGKPFGDGVLLRHQSR